MDRCSSGIHASQGLLLLLSALAAFSGCTKPVESTGMQLKAELRGSKGYVFDAKFAPDDSSIVLTCGDDGVRVWNTETWRQLRHFSREVKTIAVLPEGRVLVGGRKRLELWDYETAQLLRSYPGHEGDVYSLAVSPDGQHVLSGSGSKLEGDFQVPGGCVIRLWDIESGQQLKQIDEQVGAVTALAFLPDGKHFVSTSSDRSLRLWDLETGQILKTHGKVRRPYTVVQDGRRIVVQPIYPERIDVSKDGRLLVRENAIWNIEAWTRDFSLGRMLGPASPNCGDFSPDGARVVVGADGGLITLWDIAARTEIGRATAFANRAPVYAVAFSADGRFVVSAGNGRIGGFDGAAANVPLTEFVVRVWAVD